MRGDEHLSGGNAFFCLFVIDNIWVLSEHKLIGSICLVDKHCIQISVDLFL